LQSGCFVLPLPSSLFRYLFFPPFRDPVLFPDSRWLLLRLYFFHTIVSSGKILVHIAARLPRFLHFSLNSERHVGILAPMMAFPSPQPGPGLFAPLQLPVLLISIRPPVIYSRISDSDVNSRELVPILLRTSPHTIFFQLAPIFILLFPTDSSAPFPRPDSAEFFL